MIEPPDVSEDAIVTRVRDRFGVDVSTAMFIPEGNDSLAWAFRLDGEGSWFLKMLGRQADPGSVEVPRYLISLGVRHLVPSIATVDGAVVDEGQPFTFVLYPYFEGATAGEIGVSGTLRTDLGRLLREIHGAPISPAMSAVMRHERFDVRDADYISRALMAAPELQPHDATEANFLTAWNDHAPAIEHALARREELSEIARRSEHEMVICHADYHAWNVLIAPDDDFVVVDWDETIVAPRERDLMFVNGNVADLDPLGTDFYAGYGQVDADPRLLAFYRYDWVLQEVADYHRRTFHRALGQATRAAALAFFTRLFEPNDVVQAALDADARIA